MATHSEYVVDQQPNSLCQTASKLVGVPFTHPLLETLIPKPISSSLAYLVATIHLLPSAFSARYDRYGPSMLDSTTKGSGGELAERP